MNPEVSRFLKSLTPFLVFKWVTVVFVLAVYIITVITAIYWIFG